MNKILFICSGTYSQKPSPIIRNQANALLSKGLDIDFFLIKGKGLRGYLKSVFTLKRKLRKNKYSILHAHYGLCGIVGLLARGKEKLIVTFMGDDIVGSNSRKGSVTVLSKIFAAINIFLADNYYDYSIYKSAEMLSKAGRNKNKALIPNGVDLNTFKPGNKDEAVENVGFIKGTSNIIFVSDPLRTEKNFHLAEKAVKIIDDPKIMLHTLYNVPQELLVRYYIAADCLVLTSLHEGSPNVVKEAMSCNCPVVSTNVGDVEWLFGNSNGYFLTGYEPVEVAQNMNHALSFRFKPDQIDGRARIIELGLDSDTIAEKIMKIYKEVLV